MKMQAGVLEKFGGAFSQGMLRKRLHSAPCLSTRVYNHKPSSQHYLRNFGNLFFPLDFAVLQRQTVTSANLSGAR
jgi:hypothetical protein